MRQIGGRSTTGGIFRGVCVGLLLLTGVIIQAGEVRLKDGTILSGKPIPLQSFTVAAIPKDDTEIKIYPILMVEQKGAVRVFVPAKQVANIDRENSLRTYESFRLPQQSPAKSQMIQSAGAVYEVTDWDEMGRRRVKLQANGKDLPVFQGVTEITPDYVKVQGLSHFWEFGIPTTAVPFDQLDRMIRKVTKPDRADDRMAIARFYLQAGMYQASLRELEGLRDQFPETATAVEELASQVAQVQAQFLLNEMKFRRAAGQYALIEAAVEKFPTVGISGAILQEVQELATESELQRARIMQVRDLLGQLQAKVSEEQARIAAPLRSEITEQLHPSTLDRMEAFLNLAAAENLAPEEKLALAFSGWVLGSANAITDFDGSVRIWQARFLVQQYLQTPSPSARRELARQIRETEGLGIRQLATLIPRLPPRFESDATPQIVQTIEVPATDSGNPVKYAVVLPTEYHPGRAYPLVVTLRHRGMKVEDQITWWSGTPEQPGYGPRSGYIIIAPEYLPESQREYDYSGEAHRAVIESIYDARKRFHVDSERVYLSGHGMGGDAAFDIGMSHPDLFAGVMPIVGVSDKFCKHYYPNAKYVPFYVIGGELDRNTVALNTRDLGRMFFFGFPVIYAEYIGRGHEGFHTEIGKLFEWMPLHTRGKAPEEINVKTLRPTDNTWWWWQFSGYPPNNSFPVWPNEKTRILPMLVEGRVTPGNTITLRCGAARHVLWLNPDVVDFEKRLTIRLNGAQKFNDFVQPDIEAMLEDFRVRGDRQKLTWARIDF